MLISDVLFEMFLYTLGISLICLSVFSAMIKIIAVANNIYRNLAWKINFNSNIALIVLGLLVLKLLTHI